MKRPIVEAEPMRPMGDLSELLDPDAAAGLFRRAGLDLTAAEPDYVRLKPATGALVGYRLLGVGPAGEEVALPAYVRTFVGGRAGEVVAKWRRKRPMDTAFGPGVRLLPGGRSVLFLFPNDAALSGLRLVADMGKLKRILADLSEIGPRGYRVRGRKSSLEPVRYKPERRYIARARLILKPEGAGPGPERRDDRRGLFLRYFPDARGAGLARTARLLSYLGAPVPVPAGALLEGRLFVEEELRGEELFDAVPAGRGDPEAVADALARLHAAPVVLASDRPAGELRAEAVAGLGVLSDLDPTLRAMAEPVTSRLMAAEPPAGIIGPVQGDLHLHQIMITPDGPVIVDLERAGMGHPLQDLGQLVAHFQVLGHEGRSRERLQRFAEQLIEAVLDREAMGGSARRDLAFFLTCGLAARALMPFRRLQDGWREGAATALELALVATSDLERVGSARTRPEEVAEGAEVAVFYPRVEGPWPGWVERTPGNRVHGLYEPETDTFRRMSPEDDPALPGAPTWVARGELVCYRPGRRATVRVRDEAGIRYAKLLKPERAARLERIARAVAPAVRGSGPGAPDIPAVSESDPALGVVVFGALPGESLHRLLMRGDPGVSRALELVGGALACFHEAPLPGGALPPSPRPVGSEDWGAMVERRFPGRHGEIHGVLGALARIPAGFPGPSGPLVHGDLHDRNVVIDGDRVGLLDLDLVHAGDPVEDVGNLCAHLVLRALQRGADPASADVHVGVLLGSYRRAGGRVGRRAVAAAGARTLFRLACLYTFRSRWQHLWGPALAESERWAARAAGRAERAPERDAPVRLAGS